MSQSAQFNAYTLLCHGQLSIDEFMDASGQDLVYYFYNLFDSDVFHRNTEVVTRSIIDRAIEVRALSLSSDLVRSLALGLCLEA